MIFKYSMHTFALAGILATIDENIEKFVPFARSVAQQNIAD
jgi:hypothetical protein